MERTNLSSDLTNHTDGGQLWNGWPGSVLTYPGNQSYPNNFYCKLFVGDVKARDEQ